MSPGLAAYALVALGGAAGAVARVGLTALCAPWLSGPWATLCINVLGSGALGVLYAALPALAPTLAVELRWLLGVGVLGGFTTMSSYAIDVMNLSRAGDWADAVALAVLTPTLSLAAAVGGASLLWRLLRVAES